jgi:hypothetical protein
MMQALSVGRWTGCWVRLLDGLLQVGWLEAGSARLRLPTRIRRLSIPAPSLAPAPGSEGAALHGSAVHALSLQQDKFVPKPSTPKHHMLATVLACLLTGCEVVHAARRRMAQLLGA